MKTHRHSRSPGIAADIFPRRTIKNDGAQGPSSALSRFEKGNLPLHGLFVRLSTKTRIGILPSPKEPAYPSQ